MQINHISSPSLSRSFKLSWVLRILSTTKTIDKYVRNDFLLTLVQDQIINIRIYQVHQLIKSL